MTKARSLSVAALLGVLLFSSNGAAEEAPEQPETRTIWYGWQTLIVDAGVVGATLVTKNPGVAVGGLTLGAPIVHWAHGNVGRGFASLGIRVGTPLLTTFGVVALAMGSGSRMGPGLGEFGLGLGAVIASVLDAFVLARTTEVIPPRQPAASRWSVEPRISASPSGASAGLGGTF